MADKVNSFLNNGDHRFRCRLGRACCYPDGKQNAGRLTYTTGYYCLECPNIICCHQDCLDKHVADKHSFEQLPLTGSITRDIELLLKQPKLYWNPDFSEHTYYLSKGIRYILFEVQKGAAGLPFSTYTAVPTVDKGELLSGSKLGIDCICCKRKIRLLARIEDLRELRKA